jgi:hypothetical protein
VAEQDLYDILRALDKDRRFRECMVSLSRGPNSRLSQIEVEFLTDVDRKILAELAAWAKRTD